MERETFVSSDKSVATVYHTNVDCPRIRGNPTHISPTEIEWHELDCCRWCHGSPNGSPDGPNEVYEHLGKWSGEWP